MTIVHPLIFSEGIAILSVAVIGLSVVAYTRLKKWYYSPMTRQPCLYVDKDSRDAFVRDATHALVEADNPDRVTFYRKTLFIDSVKKESYSVVEYYSRFSQSWTRSVEFTPDMLDSHDIHLLVHA